MKKEEREEEGKPPEPRKEKVEVEKRRGSKREDEHGRCDEFTKIKISVGPGTKKIKDEMTLPLLTN